MFHGLPVPKKTRASTPANTPSATPWLFAESRVRMDNLLGVMMRLKNAKNLDTRHAAAVDAAYFAARPPAARAATRRRRSPVQVGFLNAMILV